MNKLIAFIKNLIDNKFHGKLIIGFQNGKIVNIERRMTEDPMNFRD